MAWDSIKITGDSLTAAEYNDMVADQIVRVLNSLFDAYSILYANTDNTPAALTVSPSTFVGRKAADGIVAMTPAQAKTVLAIAIADISDIPGTIAAILTDHDLTNHPLSIIPTMDDAHIPDLETLSYGAAFATAQIPNISASKITSGDLASARMQAHILAAINASVEADKIDNGQLDDLSASKTTSGQFALARMPRAVSGQFLEGNGAAADPIFNTLVEADISDLDHDAQKIKGKTVDDAAIGDDKMLVYKLTGTKFVFEPKSTGAGDVVGPASSVTERITLFDGVTGKLIKDSGKLLSNTANNIPILDGSALLPLAQVPLISLVKMANLAANSIIGNNTGLAATPLALTTAQVRTLINVEDGADVTDAVNVASTIHGVASKTIPVDADEIGLIDSAAANVLKKLTWTNLKATLKTYFDTLYFQIGAVVNGGTF